SASRLESMAPASATYSTARRIRRPPDCAVPCPSLRISILVPLTPTIGWFRPEEQGLGSLLVLQRRLDHGLDRVGRAVLHPFAVEEEARRAADLRLAGLAHVARDHVLALGRVVVLLVLVHVEPDLLCVGFQVIL